MTTPHTALDNLNFFFKRTKFIRTSKLKLSLKLNLIFVLKKNLM